MSIGQGIMVSVIESTFKFAWNTGKRCRVKRLKPEQLKEWRAKHFAKIKKEAVKLTDMVDDKKLREQGTKRADQVRIFEVILRKDLGRKMSQNLL